MNARRKDIAAKKEAAAGPIAPSGSAEKPASGNNATWDADEEPWRHPPVAPNDENPAKSLGRSVSDAIVSAAGEPNDKARAKPKQKPER